MNNALEQLISSTRSILGDYAARNKLIGLVEEYTEDEISSAVTFTVDEINSGDVFVTNHTLDALLRLNPYLVKLGVAKNVLLSKISQKSRNSLGYSDGSGYVDKESNIALYQAIYAQMSQRYDELRKAFKADLNLKNAMRY